MLQTGAAVVGLGDRRERGVPIWCVNLGQMASSGSAGDDKGSWTRPGAGPQGERKCRLSWAEGSLRRVLEQVSEMTKIFF